MKVTETGTMSILTDAFRDQCLAMVRCQGCCADHNDGTYYSGRHIDSTTMPITSAVVAAITRGSTDMARDSMHIQLLCKREDDVINALISPHQYVNGRAKSAEQRHNAHLIRGGHLH